MIRRSLVRQAILAVLLIEFLCAVGFVSTALWHEWRSRMRSLDISLEGRADSLIGAVQDAEDPENNVTVNPEEFTAPRGDIFAVYNSSGRLIGTSGGPAPEFMACQKDGFRDARFGGHRFRLLEREALRIIDRDETHGVGIRRPFTVVYATTTNHLWHETVEATEFYLLVSLGLLCATALVLIWLLRRLLAPLEQLAVSASRITTDTLQFEPPAAATRVAELVPLVQALSAMVGRVREAFDRQHRFINDAAHELKTAVAVVRSSIQVLSMRNRTAEEYRQGLDDVLSDNERVEGLVRQMLTLASFEDRNGAPRDECNLAEEVRSAAASLHSFAELQGVAVRCVLHEAKTSLSADAARTLASNLILNALQHSHSGSEVVVSVDLAPSGPDAAEPRLATLAVRDSGSGIAPENMERVFERFFREDSSRSRATGGAGLGLAICKSIVNAAGGTIDVASELGKGTEVTVTLPALRTPAIAVKPIESESAAADPTLRSAGSTR
jgi:signal transduction histidine kinase